MKRRRWWLVYGAGLAVVLAALWVVSAAALRLESDWVEARAQADRQESLRLALWRMDTWLVPLLAAEAARPAFTYESFYPQSAVVSKGASRATEPVLSPSPLLAYESEYFRLHFQVDAEGRITSPQVPQGEYRELARTGYLPESQIATNANVLNDFAQNVSLEQVASCASAAQGAEAPAAQVEAPVQQQALVDPQQFNMAQQSRSLNEMSRRQGAYRQSQNVQAGSVGAFVGFWSGSDLIFSRAVGLGGQTIYQGILCDWPKLRAVLLAQITDLFPHAELIPVRGATVEPGATLLATIPVRLDAGASAASAGAALGPLRLTLAFAWIVVLAGAAAVAATLRSTIAFGQKRARFASAVTHELRTPLTTFKLYSEMLAEGMVQEPQQRARYLETLRDESGRLSRLVENVLAYARLEEGRWRAAPRTTTLRDLLERVVPPLARRSEGAGMALALENEADPGALLRVDPEVVGQVLFNLVDNACKYAAEAPERTVHLAARSDDGQVRLSVRDHGPGVPAERRRLIFQPFERGGDAVQSMPGVGLGLALSRGLAADMGGRLELDGDGPPGATFTLTLPRAVS